MKPLICIDAGHGGIDVGKGSCEYFTEADLCLKISIYQFKRFKELNIPIILTRSSDVYLTYPDRSKIISQSGVKYCISNHLGYSKNPDTYGSELIHSIYDNGQFAIGLMEALKIEKKIRRLYCKSGKENPRLDYYFLQRLTRPVNTVTINYGFASNDDEKKKLYVLWKKYAESIVLGFCLYNNFVYFWEND